MSEYSGVTVVREANIYFGGNVTSRTIRFPDGTRKTLGVMLPGEYEFGTAVAEEMEILSGELEVKIPGQAKWLSCRQGSTFSLAANIRFQLKVKTVTDYCCSYHD
jgi:uncharacterized protein YaiE (UPF0345 family)